MSANGDKHMSAHTGCYLRHICLALFLRCDFGILKGIVDIDSHQQDTERPLGQLDIRISLE